MIIKEICTENLSVRLIENALDQQLINDEENTTKIYVEDIEQINYYIKATLKEVTNHLGEITFISQVSDVEMYVPKTTTMYKNLDEFIAIAIKENYNKFKEKITNIEKLNENTKERELLYTAHIYKKLAKSDWAL